MVNAMESFGVVRYRGKEPRPLYPHINQSLDVGCPFVEKMYAISPSSSFSPRAGSGVNSAVSHRQQTFLAPGEWILHSWCIYVYVCMHRYVYVCMYMYVWPLGNGYFTPDGEDMGRTPPELLSLQNLKCVFFQEEE